jgi:hypothetical protein
MKKILTLLLILVAIGVTQAQVNTDLKHYEAFPTFNEVLQRYFQRNSIDIKKVNFIDFAKKSDGWYIKEMDLRDWKNIKNEGKIWDAADKKWLAVLASPDYITTLETDSTLINYTIKQVKKRFATNYFDTAPVYGYDGYEEDIFQVLGTKKDLPVAQLDILARAYSQVCDKMMQRIPSIKYERTFDAYFKSFNIETISEEAVKEYVFFADKAIKTFGEMVSRFPDYYTIVGNIKVKYWNEHVAKFYDLLQLKQFDAAKKYIQKPLYDPFLVNYGQNILNSCTQGAILFTHGDLDTYTALYAQAKLQTRTDISIVNAGLINMDYHLKFQVKENRLPHSVPLKVYTETVRDYVMFDNLPDTTAFLKYTNAIKTDATPFQRSSDYGVLLAMPSRNVAIPVNNKANIVLRFGGTFAEEKEMTSSFGLSVMTRSQFFTYDVIAANQWKRPIYFSMGTSTYSRVFLNQYMHQEGLVMQLIPKLGIEKDKRQLLSNVLKYQMSEPTGIYTAKKTPNTAYVQYLYLFFDATRTAKKLAKEEELKTLIEAILKFFPYEKMSYQDFAAFIAEDCYTLGKYKAADAIVLQRANHIAALLADDDTPLGTKKKMLGEANFLVTVAGKSKQVGFLERIQKIVR